MTVVERESPTCPNAEPVFAPHWDVTAAERHEDPLVAYLLRTYPGCFGFWSDDVAVSAVARFDRKLSDEEMRQLTL